MAESAHNRLVALLDADPGLVALSGRELGALVGIRRCTANNYLRQWRKGERPRPWGTNLSHGTRRQDKPHCSRCTILEDADEVLVGDLCIPCWWRADGGNLYDYRHGEDPERWERLREVMGDGQAGAV